MARKEPKTQAITVWGYKSIYEPQTMELLPLTVLAGSNSSGKSSIMQPLLLLKQTLEVSYDPGALLLDGPNVKFSDAEQLFSRFTSEKRATEFGIRLNLSDDSWMEVHFERHSTTPIGVKSISFCEGDKQVTLTPEMQSDAI